MQPKIREESGKWIDSSVFRQEAIRFQKNGAFCSAPDHSPDWYSYWEDNLKRCLHGYEINGEKITGHHYFYLNYTQIEIVEQIKGSKASRKITQQPDFWDGDYDYFWSLEIAKNGVFSEESQVPTTKEEREIWWNIDEQLNTLKDHLGKAASNNEDYQNLIKKRNALSSEVLAKLKLKVRIHPDHLNGGYHMIISKSRRKGYSYKNGAICANTYNSERSVQVLIGASEKKFLYPKGTMGMASDYLNFLNEHTGWAKSRDYVDKQDHKRASYKTNVNGTIIEKGYKSEIFALSFKDNADASRGKSGRIMLFEEAGAFPNLKDSFAATVPAMTAGSYIIGQILIFGTGGDMASGTVDFADMFYNPEVYGLLPFINTWDENAENSTCGFFHPVTWNMEGFYDEQGNSDIEAATKFEMNRRAVILEKSSSSSALNKHTQEFPFSPAEAFMTVSSNNFPVVELRNQLNKVIHEKLQFSKGTPVYLERLEGKVIARPDLKGVLQPVINYNPKLEDLSGCPMIYEYPVDKPPRGLYKIGYDPYRQDLSSGVSLAAIYVYKANHKMSYSRNQIVAEYVGRPQEADDVNRIASMLADLYNAEIMHENEVTHVKNYFRRIKRLDQLAVQPDAVISKNVKGSTVARVYGIHMPEKIKDAGEKYIKDWLLEIRDYDENGNAILNLETIYSIGLLEELIAYSRKNNVDRVMAFMMCMFQVQEDDLGKEYVDNVNHRATEIIGMMDNFYKRN